MMSLCASQIQNHIKKCSSECWRKWEVPMSCLSVRGWLQYFVWVLRLGLIFKLLWLWTDGWRHLRFPRCHHDVRPPSDVPTADTRYEPSVSVSVGLPNCIKYDSSGPQSSWPPSDKKVWKCWLHLVTNGELQIRSRLRNETGNTSGLWRNSLRSL